MYHFSISSNSAMLDDHHQSGDNDDFYDDGDDDVAKCAGKAISIIMRSNTSERPNQRSVDRIDDEDDGDNQMMMIIKMKMIIKMTRL